MTVIRRSMWKPKQEKREISRGRLRLMRSSAVVLALLVAACDLLEVSAPDIVQPDDLDTPTGLQARRAGAFGDFAVAFTGDPTPSGDMQDGQVLASGLFSDEFRSSDTDPARIEVDARRVQDINGQMGPLYAALHRARQAAESTADAFVSSGDVPNADEVVAEMMSLAGFTYTFFGENYCAGVPFSRLTEVGDIEHGQPLTTEEIFQGARERFDEALGRAQSAGSETLESVARVGKGRALLNLGLFAEAAAAVAPVGTDFRYEVEYSTNTRRQENGVYNGNVLLERWSVTNGEGGGIEYRDAYSDGDPRTPWVVAPDSVGFDPSTGGVMYYQLIYTGPADPVPLATGVEARLIEAEAALQAGNTPEFQRIHNELRARLEDADVGPIDAEGMSPEERVDFHFRERALWMWLTGHRMGDMRRLVRQYGRTLEEAFPSGPYFRPQFPTYGGDANFPVPFGETNNPNFSGCLDRSP